MGRPKASARGAPIIPSLAEYRARIASEIVYSRDILQKPGMPLVSIVTQTLNSAETVGRAIESVRNQTYGAIEHVIVDGNSKDNSLEIIMAEKNTLGIVIRGVDISPADAANKGVAIARGAYISVLPSDDFLEPDYVEKCVVALEKSGADFVFGDLVYVEPQRERVLIPGDPRYERHIRTTMPNMSAITLMYRRECFEKVGLWDLSNAYCPDYDWLLRAHLAKLRGAYDSNIRAFFNHGGVSSANYNKALAAVRDVAIAHGAASIAANGRYFRALLQKYLREALRVILPRKLFFEIWSLVSRTGTRPFGN